MHNQQYKETLMGYMGAYPCIRRTCFLKNYSYPYDRSKVL